MSHCFQIRNVCIVLQKLICARDIDMLAFFKTFLAGFYSSHNVNLQNFYVNELTKWFVFEAIQ